MRSILQSEKVCYVCGSPNVVEHHVFYGTANREKSEKYGLKVWLCGKHHNGSNEGVHFNKNLDSLIKQQAQREFEKRYSRDKFIRTFGKNYL